jgi:hypothetical protein
VLQHHQGIQAVKLVICVSQEADTASSSRRGRETQRSPHRPRNRRLSTCLMRSFEEPPRGAPVSLLSRFRNSMPVQQAGQSAWLVGSDGDLLDDADAAAVTHRCDYEVLDVD